VQARRAGTAAQNRLEPIISDHLTGSAIPSPSLVFDCTGHRPEVASTLVKTITRSGLAAIDRHGVGLSVLNDGRVLSAQDRVTPGLFALGPLGQGSLYEITAVKEIVAQCTAAAIEISRSAHPAKSGLRAVG
jgi:uncharacterized NAD(P)/FAD-binding protein YdhS